MKTLNTLIRIHKQSLDQKRARLVEIEIERERLYAAIDDLAAELESEKVAATNSFDAAKTFPAYAAHVRVRQQAYERDIVDIEPRIAEAAEDVAEGFRELKKYEISRDIRKARENALEARREQARLDEVGNAIWRRNGAM